MSSVEWSGERVRVGTDLVRVADVAQSIVAFGDRYLHRVYTEEELAACRSVDGGWSPERLAGRFAAKESAIKALGIEDGVAYTSVEVVSRGGAPGLRLTGAAAEKAVELAAKDASLSISHDGEYATAVVAALIDESARKERK